MRTRNKIIALFGIYFILALICGYLYIPYRDPNYPTHYYQEFFEKLVVGFFVFFFLSFITLAISLVFRMINCIKDWCIVFIVSLLQLKNVIYVIYVSVDIAMIVHIHIPYIINFRVVDVICVLINQEELNYHYMTKE